MISAATFEEVCIALGCIVYTVLFGKFLVGFGLPKNCIGNVGDDSLLWFLYREWSIGMTSDGDISSVGC